MCLAYPGTVISLDGNSALVDYPDGQKKVFVGEKQVKVGDKVLVQMGIVIKTVTEAENESILEAWSEIK
jgi:hydrogenase assembly chaperone HypC/HupF